MKIALLLDSLTGGGSEGVVHRLASGLAARGHDVFVHCLKHVGREVPVHPRIFVSSHGGGRRDLLLPFRLARRFRSDGIQLVHAHTCAALCAGWPAARWLRLPIVHVRHGWTVGRQSRYSWLADRLAPFVSRVVVNSVSGRTRLPHAVRQAAVHIPNGIAVAPADPGEARRELESLCRRPLPGPIVLCVANIRPEKDTLTLLRAMAQLRKRVPDASLVCIGGCSNDIYQRQVLAERDRLGLQYAAAFLGPLANAARMMPGADVLCLSSCTESMPNVILEAMAHCVPIVATAVGDVGRIGPGQGGHMLEHRRTALLAEPGDADGLAAGLLDAITQREAAVERAQHAFERYRNTYSLSQMVDRYERLYTECLTGPAHHARRPRVLMVGPAAPQIGGMVTSIDTLMRSPLTNTFHLHRFATVVPRPRRLPTTNAAARIFAAACDAARTPLAAVRHGFALLSLAVHIAMSRIDIVHFHTCSFGTFYRTLADLAVAQLLRCRTVLHVRGGRFAEFCTSRGPLGRWVIRRAAESADRVILLGESIATELRPRFGNARIEIVPNAVRIPAPAPIPAHEVVSNPPPRPCRFLFVGELSPAKGIDDLLDAAERLCDANAEFELWLAGPPSIRADRLDRIAGAQLRSRVRCLGIINARQRDEALRSIDCLVHPSRSEAMPNVILEAGAAGVPVIATAVGCVAEILQARSMPQRGQVCWDGLAPLVSSGDAAALADAMLTLARDAGRRRAIGQALRRRIEEEYSDCRLAQRLTRIYADLLGGSPSAITGLPPTRTDAPVRVQPIGGGS